MRRQSDIPYQKINSTPPDPPEYVPEETDLAEREMLERLEAMKLLGPKPEENS